MGARKAAPRRKSRSKGSAAAAAAARAANAAGAGGGGDGNSSGGTGGGDGHEVVEVDDEGNVIDPQEERYCLCNRVSFGTMIQCDNVDVSLPDLLLSLLTSSPFTPNLITLGGTDKF